MEFQNVYAGMLFFHFQEFFILQQQIKNLYSSGNLLSNERIKDCRVKVLSLQIEAFLSLVFFSFKVIKNVSTKLYTLLLILCKE